MAIPATGASIGCAGEWAHSPICIERQEAVDARAKAEALMESLPELTEPPWDPVEFEAANALYQEGMALYRDEYFGEATAKFRSAIERLIAIERNFQALVAQGLADRQEALDARAKTEALMESLPELTEPPWDPVELEAANALYQEGMALYRDEYFGKAAAKFRSAMERLIAIERNFQTLVAQGLATADAAMDEENFESAAAGYASVLGLLPHSTEAAAGLVAARQGIEASGLLREALQHIDQRDLAAADAKIAAIPAGLLSESVGQARHQIRGLRQRERLNRSMSEGFRHIDRSEWLQAEAAFKDALKTDPASAAARDALEDVRRRRADTELRDYRAQLETRLATENWLASQELLQKMRQLVPHDTSIADELSRITHLVNTEQMIDRYLSQPQRNSTKAIRDDVMALVEVTVDRETYGGRIIDKRAELQQLLGVWTTRVKLTIYSDNRTQVLIRPPGRDLGKFKERQLEVFPGNYALIGRRVGYREVAKKISVDPNAGALTFEIVCNERF